MLVRFGFVFLSFLISLNSNVRAGTQNKKAHVHGAGKLTIALENEKSGTIALDIPAESLLGFEHRARNAGEAGVIKQAFDKFKNNLGSVVRADPKLGCVFSDGKIDFEEPEPSKEAATKESHADLNASYTISCKEALSNTSFRIGLMSLFPRVKQLNLQILSPNGQSEKKVTHAEESFNF